MTMLYQNLFYNEVCYNGDCSIFGTVNSFGMKVTKQRF